MELNKWLQIERRIEDMLRLAEGYLDNESREAVRHYLKYSEYEMAMEILCTEMMKLNSVRQVNPGQMEDLAIQLNLYRESVFDELFWEKFSAWLLL